MKSGFALSKWYADCVPEQGDAIILYSAELCWRTAVIPYTSLLVHRAGCPTRTRFSLRRQHAPRETDGVIEWKSSAWRAEGSWREPGGAVHETLFDSPDGSLQWHCIAPRAAARFRIAGEELCGWGYVEHLRLTVPPWRLPIQRLRWGRFVNPTDALVWIDWSGPYQRRVVYHNGGAVAAREIGDREVVLGDGETVLSLDAPSVLREGALGATALAMLPARILPARILQVREQKWLSRAVLRRPGCPDSTGMAIHEVVEWP